METLCAGELEYKWYLRKVVSNISKSQPMKWLFRVCFKRFSFVGRWPMGPLQKGYCDALGTCRQDRSCLPAHTLSCDKGSRREDEARAPRRRLCIHLESPRLPRRCPLWFLVTEKYIWCFGNLLPDYSCSSVWSLSNYLNPPYHSDTIFVWYLWLSWWSPAFTSQSRLFSVGIWTAAFTCF